VRAGRHLARSAQEGDFNRRDSYGEFILRNGEAAVVRRGSAGQRTLAGARAGGFSAGARLGAPAPPGRARPRWSPGQGQPHVWAGFWSIVAVPQPGALQICAPGRPISRVLSWAVISLGRRLPAASCGLPGARTGRAAPC